MTFTAFQITFPPSFLHIQYFCCILPHYSFRINLGIFIFCLFEGDNYQTDTGIATERDFAEFKQILITMKISMYTFLFQIDIKFYIYNTLSNALIEIEKDTYAILLAHKNNHTLLKEADLCCNELYQTLKETHAITEDDRDEFLLLKNMIYSMRSCNVLNLTIAPTMDCNYSCSYCFETCKHDIYMDKVVMDSIINFIHQYENVEKVHITWFGGEPLMGIDQIEYLYKKMIQIPEREFTFSMITNGFLITEKIIDLLKKMRLRYLQITLDGLKDTHNKVKYTKDKDDTFTKTMDNIDLLASSAPEIGISIRVNINKENAHEFSELHNYVTKRYVQYPQVGIYPAFVSALQPDSYSIIFARKEKADFISELFYTKGIKTHLCKYPNGSIDECSTRNKNTLTIDPNGYLYKCWEIVGDTSHSFGKLDNEGRIHLHNQTILNRYLYGADPIDDKKCSKCPYLPICFGGCPHQRIKNEFLNERHDTCTHLKGALKEFIKIHLLEKE